MKTSAQLRWFTDDAYAWDDDARWRRMLADYMAHVASIEPRLPRDLARLATDPGLNLHDWQIVSMSVAPTEGRVQMVVQAGDGQRRLDCRFGGARILPEDYPRLAMAIETKYRASAWGDRRDLTTIMAMEVGLTWERFVLRLRLEPFHAFAIEFDTFWMTQSELAEGHPAGPGVFRLRR
jgi:hypothetical protein